MHARTPSQPEGRLGCNARGAGRVYLQVGCLGCYCWGGQGSIGLAANAGVLDYDFYFLWLLPRFDSHECQPLDLAFAIPPDEHVQQRAHSSEWQAILDDLQLFFIGDPEYKQGL